MAVMTAQLSQSNPPPDRAQLEEIVASPATELFVAFDDDGEGDAGGGGTIVGSLTLALFRIPTAMRAWIEDVVVDEAARGKGVGEMLSRAAIDRARGMSARRLQ